MPVAQDAVDRREGNELADSREVTLTNGVNDRADAAACELGALVGRAELANSESPAWGDDRFLGWCADEARRADRVGERRSDAATYARGVELMARTEAKRLGVHRELAVAHATHESAGQFDRARHCVPHFDLAVAAGVGRELWEESPVGWVEVPSHLPPGDYLSLRIAGTSMTPLMHDGDVVLIRRGSVVRRDTVIVARHPDDGYVCKRVVRLTRDTIELASLEPVRPQLTVPHDPALVLGTVLLVWCSHRQE